MAKRTLVQRYCTATENHRQEREYDPSEKGPHSGPMDLTQLPAGSAARVVEVRGGHHVAGRLEALEVVPGTTIRKKCSSPMKGPIVLEIGATQLAIGYGTAQKIIVEPLTPASEGVFL